MDQQPPPMTKTSWNVLVGFILVIVSVHAINIGFHGLFVFGLLLLGVTVSAEHKKLNTTLINIVHLASSLLQIFGLAVAVLLTNIEDPIILYGSLAFMTGQNALLFHWKKRPVYLFLALFFIHLTGFMLMGEMHLGLEISLVIMATSLILTGLGLFYTPFYRVGFCLYALAAPCIINLILL
jgi:hypothetical protein